MMTDPQRQRMVQLSRLQTPARRAAVKLAARCPEGLSSGYAQSLSTALYTAFEWLDGPYDWSDLNDRYYSIEKGYLV